MLCHPYDIGSARSLPWNDAAGWTGTRADYKLENLISDTDALLTPTTPVVVRMETLRRAAIYASTDAKLAKELLSRLNAKVDSAEAAGHPDALALLDAAYVTEAFRMNCPRVSSASTITKSPVRLAMVQSTPFSYNCSSMPSRCAGVPMTMAGCFRMSPSLRNSATVTKRLRSLE